MESPADGSFAAGSFGEGSFATRLRADFKAYGDLSDQQLALLDRHFQLLLQWNPRLNLTRITEVQEAVLFHYCESLLVGTVLPPGPLTVGDLGSGAGFPGIPIAIFRPDVSVVLLESDTRKAVFLREATRGLENIQVLTMRFEAYKGRFDWVVSRAVSPPEVWGSGLASQFAILMSASAAPEGSEVIRLPWGRDRALVVSRNTESK